jgi:hypothetical protein
VHAEALVVTADFVFNRWDLEILPYYQIRHIPWCVRYHAQSLWLEAFEYFYVGRGCGSPELYSVGPDWFECSFVDEESVVYREFWFCVRVASTFWWGQYLVVSVWLRCVYARCLLSRCSPRYLTSSVWESWTLLMSIGGHVPLRVMNVMCWLKSIGFHSPFCKPALYC